jgi:hypothetical protein
LPVVKKTPHIFELVGLLELSVTREKEVLVFNAQHIVEMVRDVAVVFIIH